MCVGGCQPGSLLFRMINEFFPALAKVSRCRSGSMFSFISPAGAQGLVKSPFTIITTLLSSYILPPPAQQNPPANSRPPDKTSDKSWRTVSLKFASPPSLPSPLKVTPSPPPSLNERVCCDEQSGPK